MTDPKPAYYPPDSDDSADMHPIDLECEVCGFKTHENVRIKGKAKNPKITFVHGAVDYHEVRHGKIRIFALGGKGQATAFREWNPDGTLQPIPPVE